MSQKIFERIRFGRSYMDKFEKAYLKIINEAKFSRNKMEI